MSTQVSTSSASIVRVSHGFNGTLAVALEGRSPDGVQIVHETLQADADSPATSVSYFLDGAHTPESILTCARWFARAAGGDTPSIASSDQSAASAASAQPSTQRVLVFNCTKVPQQGLCS